MKLRYRAVDRNGRPVTGLMEAPDEETARLMLLDATIFPKGFEPADDEGKVTWRPPDASTANLKEKVDRQRRGESEDSVLFRCQTEMLEGSNPAGAKDDLAGRRVHLKLRKDELEIQIDGLDPVTITGKDIETCRYSGLITKQWDLVLVDGHQYCILAGRLRVKPEVVEMHQRIMTWIM